MYDDIIWLQEFVAYGLMNIVGCFFSSFTAAGSLSRSSIQASTGGKTQLVGIISSMIILVVLLKLGSLFEPLPRVCKSCDHVQAPPTNQSS